MPRALTEKDVPVLDTVLAALMETFSPGGSGIDETDESDPPQARPTEETMNTIDRLRMDGKAIVRTERVVQEGKTFRKLHFPRTDFPGGPMTVCVALILRMARLAGEAVPDDERDKLTPQGVDSTTIERLAASIEIVEPAETVH